MIKRHLISAADTLRVALGKLNELSGGAMTLFVIDSDGRMTGTLTDGDIRRALLRGITLDSRASEAAKAPFHSVSLGNIDVAELRECRSKRITLVPVLDAEGCPVSLIDLTRSSSVLPLKAILMAGGKGERLRPATLTRPKPLLEIEGKAIIDYNVEALAACGISDITVCTHYLSELIDEHFRHPVAGVAVKTVRENTPLGTIGAVALTGAATAPGDTLVMNSDLLTTISFEEMYLRHHESGADITIAVVPYQVSVPYAILDIDPADPTAVRGIEEKPSYSYYANAGIYIFDNSLLATLSPDRRCDATDLISRAIEEGRKVTYYPIKGTWIDVGSPVDFRQAAELMRHHNSMTESNR